MACNEILTRLYETILSRKGGDASASYAAQLFSKGSEKISKKLNEETLETILAYQKGDKEQVVYESADLLFHLLVLLADSGVTVEEVVKELERREGTSGIEEKNLRTK